MLQRPGHGVTHFDPTLPSPTDRQLAAVGAERHHAHGKRQVDVVEAPLPGLQVPHRERAFLRVGEVQCRHEIATVGRSSEHRRAHLPLTAAQPLPDRPGVDVDEMDDAV